MRSEGKFIMQGEEKMSTNFNDWAQWRDSLRQTYQALGDDISRTVFDRRQIPKPMPLNLQGFASMVLEKALNGF